MIFQELNIGDFFTLDEMSHSGYHIIYRKITKYKRFNLIYAHVARNYIINRYPSVEFGSLGDNMLIFPLEISLSGNNI